MCQACLDGESVWESDDDDEPVWKRNLVGKILIPTRTSRLATCWWQSRPSKKIKARRAKKAHPVNTSKRVGLFTLPVEIRLEIYEHLFQGITAKDWTGSDGTHPAPEIFTCRQIYIEARSLAYARAPETFRLEDLPLEKAKDYVEIRKYPRVYDKSDWKYCR